MRTVLLVVLCAAPAAAEEVVVTMAGSAYAPATITASVGDTLRFVNDDGADHNVFVPTAGHAFDLGKQEAGAETTYRLGQPGAFDIECVFHPDMHARVEITQ